MAKIGSDDISKMYLGSEDVLACYLGNDLIYELNEGTTPYIKSDGKTLVCPKGCIGYDGVTPTIKRVTLGNLATTFGTYGYRLSVDISDSEITSTRVSGLGPITFDGVSYSDGASNANTSTLWQTMTAKLAKQISRTTSGITDPTYVFADGENPYYYVSEIFFDKDVDSCMWSTNPVAFRTVDDDRDNTQIATLTVAITSSLVSPTTSNSLWVANCVHSARSSGTDRWNTISGSREFDLPSNKRLYMWVFVSSPSNSVYKLDRWQSTVPTVYQSTYGRWANFCIYNPDTSPYVGYPIPSNYGYYTYEIKINRDGTAELR